jgi:hypothetical protein
MSNLNLVKGIGGALLVGATGLTAGVNAVANATTEDEGVIICSCSVLEGCKKDSDGTCLCPKDLGWRQASAMQAPIIGEALAYDGPPAPTDGTGKPRGETPGAGSRLHEGMIIFI